MTEKSECHSTNVTRNLYSAKEEYLCTACGQPCTIASKPDERFLTDEEISDLARQCNNEDYGHAIAEAQDTKTSSLKDEEANALAKEITNLYGDLEKQDRKIAELTEQKNNLMKQLLLEIGDGKIERDKLQATHKKEVESIFQEFGTLVDLSKLPFILDVINSIKSKHLKASVEGK